MLGCPSAQGSYGYQRVGLSIDDPDTASSFRVGGLVLTGLEPTGRLGLHNFFESILELPFRKSTDYHSRIPCDRDK